MIFPSKPGDVPLHKDDAAYCLTSIIGILVYLATLALAAHMGLNHLAQGWYTGLSGSLTVEIRPLEPSAGKAMPDRFEAVRQVLAKDSAILRVELLAREEVNKLLEPWLGGIDLGRDVALPMLVDVQVKNLTPEAKKALVAKITAAAPGVVVDDHASWLEDLRELAVMLQFITLAIICLIAVAAVMAIIFVVRAGLAIHENIIRLLHRLGAPDGYIARQFQNYAWRLGLLGGGVGGALAFLTLGLLVLVSVGLALPTGERLLPALTQIIALLLLPVIAAILAAIVTRVTVLWRLRRYL